MVQTEDATPVATESRVTSRTKQHYAKLNLQSMGHGSIIWFKKI